jgi:Zn-finger nucleic acid-binding protein
MKTCPRCGGSLRKTTLGAASVEGCGGCGGIWFAHDALAATAQAQHALLSELEQHLQTGAAGTAGTALVCPDCHAALVEFALQHSPGIRLDGCPQCQGIWVDDHELEAIHDRYLEKRPDEAKVGAPPQRLPAPSPAEFRLRGREAMGFLSNLPCPNCKMPNPTASLTCWACGVVLQGKPATLCPRCDTQMAGKTRLGVRMDTCFGCGGIWLDWGELPSLIRRAPEEIRELEAEIPRAIVGDSVQAQRATLVCPLCYLPMVRQQYAYNSGVQIDTCLGCKGVWLDAGELTNLAEFCARDQARRRR